MPAGGSTPGRFNNAGQVEGHTPRVRARLLNKLQTDRSGDVLFLPYAPVGTKMIK